MGALHVQRMMKSYLCQSATDTLASKIRSSLIAASFLLFVGACGGGGGSQAQLEETPPTGTPDPDPNPSPQPPPVSATCSLTISPGDSFDEAFSKMDAGDLLCLNEGTYNQNLDIPDNLHVQAVNDGRVEINGNGNLGQAWSGAILQLHGSNSSVKGLRVHHASENADACSIAGNNNVMRLMSCSHGGSHKHKLPFKISGTNHLIEDSWGFGEGRYVFQCFIGDHITLRRNVARWDSTEPNNPTEPNAAFAIYNCSEMTIENNISLDYGVPQTSMQFGGDFYSPQNASVYPEGNQNNHWLGNFAINHAVATDNRRAFRLDASTETFGNVARDFYIRGSRTAFVANSLIKELAISNCTLIDVDSVGAVPGQPPIDCGQGADTLFRYQDREKTTYALFPWPHQDLIKSDMCAPGERQSDWCLSNLSLSEYVLQN